MARLSFVFSNQYKWRLFRHLSFWLCWYLSQVYLYAFTPSPMLNALSFWERIQMNFSESFWYLAPALFLAYMTMYVVIPKLVIPAMYFKAIIFIIILLIITGGISALLSLTVIEHFRQLFFVHHPHTVRGPINTPLHIRLFLAWISGFRGSITIGGLAAAIKLMKYFYEKQQQTLMLEQQKTIAELKSLKAQLHPHFLFNTLNNIYAYTQETAPVAADMLLQLSTLLRYILYACNAPLVPLEQEISMITEYAALEKKRYGNALEISIQRPAEYNGLLIAPLLILPFFENCFKHGTSGILENPWINMQIFLENNVMKMKLINGKQARGGKESIGIGIENVRRRLDLLYPDKHQLTIIEEDEVYIVNLNIELIKP